MKWNKRLNQLNDALALLIPFPNDAIFFLERAGIDTEFINFYGTPLNIWNNILHYAIANEKVNNLVEEILKAYPNNPYLINFDKEMLHDYNLGIDIKSIDWKARNQIETKEKLTANNNTSLPIKTLLLGIEKSKAVARVRIQRDKVVELATGFLISKNMFITNHHAIKDIDTARIATIQFGYEESTNVREEMLTSFTFDAGSSFIFSQEHDWTAIKIDGDANSLFGELQMVPGSIKVGDSVYIIQHPAGGYKQIKFFNNVVTYIDNNVIQYVTDGEPASSGSPVFNTNWQVVALHHTAGFQQESLHAQYMFRNEGIVINRIVEGLQINNVL